MDARRLQRFVLIMGLSCLASMTAAQPGPAGYPARPIRFLVPFAAGAATDIGARNLATRLGEVLGQPIVVENRPGAGGNVATRMLVQAPADGYTMLAGGTSTVSNVHLYAHPGYDLFRDLNAVAGTTSAASLLIVNEKSPHRTAAELVEAVRSRPEKLTYGSGGIGTSAHMVGSALLKLVGAEGIHVPYKSAAEIVQGVLGGQVDFGAPILAVAHGQAKAGRLRALAVSTPARHPFFPEVPTFTEAFPGRFELTTWFGVFVATGTAPTIVDRLHAGIVKVQRTPEFEQATVRDGSLVFMSESPEQLAQWVRKEYELYRTLVARTGAKVE